MPKKVIDENKEIVNLLAKLLVLQLYSLSVPQDKIGKAVGRQKLWVNEFLKIIPKGGKKDGETKKPKKGKGRTDN